MMRLILAALLCLAFVAPSEAGLFRKKGKRIGGKARSVVKAIIPGQRGCRGGSCAK